MQMKEPGVVKNSGFFFSIAKCDKNNDVAIAGENISYEKQLWVHGEITDCFRHI